MASRDKKSLNASQSQPPAPAAAPTPTLSSPVPRVNALPPALQDRGCLRALAWSLRRRWLSALTVGILAAAAAASATWFLLPPPQETILEAVASVAVEKIDHREPEAKDLRPNQQLEELLQTSRQVLTGKRQRLQELTGPARTGDAASVTALVRSLNAWRVERQKELLEIETDLGTTESLLQQRSRTVPKISAPPMAPVTPAIVSKEDPELQADLKQLAEVQRQAGQIMANAASPEVARQLIKERRLDEQIAALTTAVQRRRKPAPTPLPKPPEPESRTDLTQLETRLAVDGEGRKRLQQEIEQLTRQIQGVSKLAAELEVLQKEFASAEEDLGKRALQVSRSLPSAAGQIRAAPAPRRDHGPAPGREG